MGVPMAVKAAVIAHNLVATKIIAKSLESTKYYEVPVSMLTLTANVVEPDVTQRAAQELIDKNEATVVLVEANLSMGSATPFDVAFFEKNKGRYFGLHSGTNGQDVGNTLAASGISNLYSKLILKPYQKADVAEFAESAKIWLHTAPVTYRKVLRLRGG
jgi:hypothetical protein